VLIYRKLSHYLGSDQPFYGLQAHGLDGISPLMRTIEDMAAQYIKEIRRVQARGPYFLGGYCLGGTIAYEAAQQLHAAGEEIALLALFDTMNWQNVQLTTWSRVSLRFQRLVFHAAVLLDLESEGKRKFLQAKLRDLRSRVPVWIGMMRTKFNTRISAGDTSDSLVLGRVWQASHRASHSYIPKPYPGVVTDLRPGKQYRILDKADLKWDRLAEGGQRIVVIPGYPAVMLVEPYVQDLAAMLTTCIDDAIRRSKSGRSQDISTSDSTGMSGNLQKVVTLAL
jgi:thioesterase domain-containing protein